MNESTYVTQVASSLAPKMMQDLADQGFEISKPPYTHFAAKKKALSVSFYTSGKLVIQGKEMREFIEFYLEPEILKNVAFTYAKEGLNKMARIGVDEAGKGDFFGPLCIAAVFAEGKGLETLHDQGVRDSKSLSDATCIRLAKAIREQFPHSLVQISPPRYNELYDKFRNLNRLLAWGHATAIENLSKVSGCTCVIIDQFAHESVVARALEKKNIKVELEQKHHAESDLVVAAASILARAAFLGGLRTLGEKIGMELPKGASEAVIKTGKKLVAKFGVDVLREVSKTHFRTHQQIIEG